MSAYETLKTAPGVYSFEEYQNGGIHIVYNNGNELYIDSNSLNSGTVNLSVAYGGYGGGADYSFLKGKYKGDNPPSYAIMVAKHPQYNDDKKYNIIEQAYDTLSSANMKVSGLNVTTYSNSGNTGFEQLDYFLGEHRNTVSNVNMTICDGYNIEDQIITPQVKYKNIIDNNIPIYNIDGRGTRDSRNVYQQTEELSNLGYDVTYLTTGTDSHGTVLKTFEGSNLMPQLFEKGTSSTTSNINYGSYSVTSFSNNMATSTPSSTMMTDNTQVYLNDAQRKMYDKLFQNAKSYGNGKLISMDGADIWVPNELEEKFVATVYIPGTSTKDGNTFFYGLDGKSSLEKYLKTNDVHGIVYMRHVNDFNNGFDGSPTTEILETIKKIANYRGANDFFLNASGGSFGGPSAMKLQVEAAKLGYSGVLVLYDGSSNVIVHEDGTREYVTTASTRWNNGFDYRFTDEDLQALKDNNVPIFLYDTNSKNFKGLKFANFKRYAAAGLNIYVIPNTTGHDYVPMWVVRRGGINFFSGENGTYDIETPKIYKMLADGTYAEVTDIDEIKRVISLAFLSEQSTSFGQALSGFYSFLGSFSQLGSLTGFEKDDELIKSDYNKAIEFLNPIVEAIKTLESISELNIETPTCGSTTAVPSREAEILRNFFVAIKNLVLNLYSEATTIANIAQKYEDLDANMEEITKQLSNSNDASSETTSGITDSPASDSETDSTNRSTGGYRSQSTPSGGGNSTPINYTSNNNQENVQQNNNTETSENTVDTINNQTDSINNSTVINNVESPTQHTNTNNVDSTQYNNENIDNQEKIETDMSNAMEELEELEELDIEENDNNYSNNLDNQETIINNNPNQNTKNNNTASTILKTGGILAGLAAGTGAAIYGAKKIKEMKEQEEDEDDDNI